MIPISHVAHMLMPIDRDVLQIQAADSPPRRRFKGVSSHLQQQLEVVVGRISAASC